MTPLSRLNSSIHEFHPMLKTPYQTPHGRIMDLLPDDENINATDADEALRRHGRDPFQPTRSSVRALSNITYPNSSITSNCVHPEESQKKGGLWPFLREFLITSWTGLRPSCPWFSIDSLSAIKPHTRGLRCGPRQDIFPPY